MTKTNMVITMAPTVDISETDLITPIVVGCLEHAQRPIHFKTTVDKITDGKIKFVETHKGTMVQIDELKKFDIVIECDDPKMWGIFRDMVRIVCKVTETERPTPIPIKCYLGEIMERYHDQIEAPPYIYTTEQYFGKPIPNDDDIEGDDDSDSDDDIDGSIDDDPNWEERERRELDESRRERRQDIRAYYYDRI